MLRALVTMTLCALSFTSVTALAVELDEATNRDLIEEVRFRMVNDDPTLIQRLERALGEGGMPGVSSRMTFSCTDGRYFFVSNAGRVVTNKSFLFRDTARCFREVQNYSARFNEIFRPMTMAVCDSNGFLIQSRVTPDGGIAQISSVRTGDMAACLNQAEMINASQGGRF